MLLRSNIITILGILLIQSGCTKEREYTAEFSVFPVSGVVEVDGTPAESVWVVCNPIEGASELKAPAITTSDADGQFHFTTYKSNDGLPKGEYTLTFKWESPGPGRSIDKLHGKYANPAKSEHKMKVEEASENDLGTFSLSSK